MTEAQLLPFGAAPVPSASADIESRVIRLLASLAQPGVSGLDSARVAAVLDGSDLASLRVEVTGLAVDDHRLSAAPLTPPTVDVAHREPATVRARAFKDGMTQSIGVQETFIVSPAH